MGFLFVFLPCPLLNSLILFCNIGVSEFFDKAKSGQRIVAQELQNVLILYYCGIMDAMGKTKQDLLKEWSELWIPHFNELSLKYNTPYYTQSPLNVIETDIEMMVVGINPKGTGKCTSTHTANGYLEGNKSWWSKRFDKGLKDSRFLANGRLFLGCGSKCPDSQIDDDKKVVWTNLSPFESSKGVSNLKKELLAEGIKSTIELIKILQPKRIVFMETNAFDTLRMHMGEPDAIQSVQVFDNLKWEVGICFGIPAVNVLHPSATDWLVSKYFISVFLFLHNLIIHEFPNKPLMDIRNAMRNELKLWKHRIS